MTDRTAEGRPKLAGDFTEGFDDSRPVHLVMRAEWPIALCGATVNMHLGNRAPGRDRCPACLKIANERKLGRPGWLESPTGPEAT